MTNSTHRCAVFLESEIQNVFIESTKLDWKKIFAEEITCKTKH